MSAARSKRSFLRRVMPTAMVALLAVAFLVVFAGATRNATREARFTQCRNNLKQITLALHNYHDVYDCFPPAVTYGPDGKPWHSWRVLIYQFLEASPFNRRYRLDEPWDGPNNRKLRLELDAVLTGSFVFHCPSDESAATQASYLAVIGDRTMWPEHGTASLDDATDGPEIVIQVVEVANSGAHWMEPKDLRLDEMTFRLNGEGKAIRSRHTEPSFLTRGQPKANAVFADGSVGSVKPITADVSPETLRSMLLRDDGGPSGLP